MADDGSVPSDVLYEDEYVRVTNTHVVLKAYYIPGLPKNIAFGDIEKCQTDRQYGVTPLGYKNWGMGLASIWWAWGGVPREKYNYVITVRNAWPCCGFSVERPAEFRAVLAAKGVPGIQKTDL